MSKDLNDYLPKLRDNSTTRNYVNNKSPNNN